jgi:hypothetical protein
MAAAQVILSRALGPAGWALMPLIDIMCGNVLRIRQSCAISGHLQRDASKPPVFGVVRATAPPRLHSRSWALGGGGSSLQVPRV